MSAQSPFALRPHAAVILLAAGDGARVGAETNKVLLPLNGLPVFGWSLRWLERLEYVERVVVVIREQDRDVVEKVVADRFPRNEIAVVTGGVTRHDSEWKALSVLADAIDDSEINVVAVHDGARPLAGSALFRAVIDKAVQGGGAVPVREQRALIERAQEPAVGPARLVRLVGVQTPQAFRARPLLEAYRQAELEAFLGTDTASCVERYTDLSIHVEHCSATNLKITHPEDVGLAGRLLDDLLRDEPELRDEPRGRES